MSVIHSVETNGQDQLRQAVHYALKPSLSVTNSSKHKHLPLSISLPLFLAVGALPMIAGQV